MEKIKIEDDIVFADKDSWLAEGEKTQLFFARKINQVIDEVGANTKQINDIRHYLGLGGRK